MIEFTICIWLLFSLLTYGLTNDCFYKMDGRNHRLVSIIFALLGPLPLPGIILVLSTKDTSEIGFKL